MRHYIPSIKYFVILGHRKKKILQIMIKDDLCLWSDGPSLSF